MKAFSFIKRFVLRILPAYAFIPAILAVSCHFIAYYILKAVLRDTPQNRDRGFSSPLKSRVLAVRRPLAFFSLT